MTGSAKLLRCAVYTRKSTEHNLDLEFNSLHAQREACEAYIKSQMHEGWRLIQDCYDDGGISGASLARPDLQRLLGDIQAGKVDTVVVYKVDRLTRSLTDFAKLVELFDKHGVSFVSVTQAFNTTTSMGRLTLNVLLSFAQFEREVIGERVRDKIAASKKKGLWMGGPVPLGYVNIDKKLSIVPEEADAVRWIFQKYLELGAVGPLLQELDRVGIKTKATRRASGRVVGGGRFGKGGLNHLLKNRCYIGELSYRGQVHTADHEPILERELFEAVQAKLAANNVEKRLWIRSSPYLLTGLIFDSVGNRMTPAHTLKKGVRYRYYVSQAILQRRDKEAGAIGRVPAPEIETLVWQAVATRLALAGSPPIRETLEAKVQRITVQSQSVELAFWPSEDPQEANSIVPDISDSQLIPWAPKPPVAIKGIAHEAVPPSVAEPKAQEAILAAIGKARLWLSRLSDGVPLAQIAQEEGKGERQIRLLMPLAFVPPDTVRGLINGTVGTKTVTEMSKNVPLSWC